MAKKSPAVAVAVEQSSCQITGSKVRSTFHLKCRNVMCSCVFAFKEGDEVHNRCSSCGVNRVKVIEDGQIITDDKIWEVVETGELVKGGGVLEVV